jgi:hypothetical protein
MNRIKKATLSIALLLISVAQACVLFTPPPTAEPETTNTPHPVVPADTPAIEPHEIAEMRSCPVNEAQNPTINLTDPLAAEVPLLDYLNSGGDINTLNDNLTYAAMIPAAGFGTGEIPINEDSLLDFVFLLVEPDSANLHPFGRLYVFLCDQDHYTTAYTSAVDENWFNPQIHTLQDLNMDGLEEIVFSESQCGAHTCFADVQILGWKAGEMANLLSGSSSDMPYPVVDISTEEGLPTSVIVTATAIGSAGAGPFQPFQRIWQWNPDTGLFEPGEDIILETSYRIHAFYAAEDRFAEGDIEQALAGYDKVINDSSLSDWGDPGREQIVLSAFSQFRKIQVLLVSGNETDASLVYSEWMAQEPQAPSAAFREAAEIYMNTYNEAGSLSDACQAVETYAADHTAELIDSLYFGYSNRMYEPAALCRSDFE